MLLKMFVEIFEFFSSSFHIAYNYIYRKFWLSTYLVVLLRESEGDVCNWHCICVCFSCVCVQSEADFEMTELLQTDIKSILNLLLLNLTSHRLRVLAAIKLLAEMNQTSMVYDSEEKIVNYSSCLYWGAGIHWMLVDIYIYMYMYAWRLAQWVYQKLCYSVVDLLICNIEAAVNKMMTSLNVCTVAE